MPFQTLYTGLASLYICIYNYKNVNDLLHSFSVCHLECDFDHDFCQWTQMATDVFDWERHNGSTPTPSTGPLSDHTTGGIF